ncbi:MAG: AMP-binding protein [Myxococcota bacterium]|jgi:long-chain acyl-CoA synthetase|nr:AMP-binding protein [Myxococcota bacterium]
MATLSQLFETRALEHPSKTAWLRRHHAEWEDISWRDWQRSSHALARSLSAMGCSAGEHIAILMNMRYEWALIDTALAQLNAVPIHLPQHLESPKLCSCLRELQPRLAFVNDPRMLALLLENTAPRPPLEHIFYVDAQRRDAEHLILLEDVCPWPPPPSISSFDELLHRAEHRLPPPRLAARVNAEAEPHSPPASAPAAICFSAGSCGSPQAFVLSQEGSFEAAHALARALGLSPTDLCLFHTSSRHPAARQFVHACIAAGCAMVAADEPADCLQLMSELSPSLAIMPSRRAEALHRALLSLACSEFRLRPGLLSWALNTAESNRNREKMGKKTGAFLALKRHFAQRLALSRLHTRIGSKLGRIITLGKKLHDQSERFFDLFGISVLESYGCVELGGITHIQEDADSGLIALPHVRQRLSETGELLLHSVSRGLLLSATASAHDAAPSGSESEQRRHSSAACLTMRPRHSSSPLREDGWFRSDDLAEFGEHRQLKYRARSCESILIGAATRILTAPLERELENDPLIAYALIVDHEAPFLSALLFPEESELLDWCRRHDIQGSLEQVCLQQAVYDAFAERINAFNVARPSLHGIRKFALVSARPSIESGELTDLLELRRGLLIERHAALIASFYHESF